MRIKFIVTGDLEKASMVDSIRRYFERTGEGGEVIWLRPRKVDAATASRLDPGRDYKAMRRLAQAMITEAENSGDGKPCDLVIAIDDLELANQDQPKVVADQIKRHVEAEIHRRRSSMAGEQRLRGIVRKKCSFHLLAPMVEAYIFGDPNALVRAGVATADKPKLLSADVEDFETNDPDFLPKCERENARRAQEEIFWWKHERHPKHYLEWLVEQDGGFYDEVLGGVAAFRDLAWPSVPSSKTAAAFARSLFEDIAEALGVENPLGAGAVARETWPDRKVRRDQLLLRNM